MTKQKTKHTPGPWTFVQRHSSFICSVVHESETDFISIVDECTESNARLIAAAPELLEALLDAEALLIDCPAMVSRSSQAQDALNAIQYAIRKARGEK